MSTVAAVDKPVEHNGRVGGLARDDWFLLPLISVSTILLLFGAAEVITRLVWPQVDQDSCFVNDPIAGYRFRPNCTSRMKSAEGPWTTNRYNECGYRTDAHCGPKPPDTKRLVFLGSSVAQGLFAPYEDALATKTARIVGHETGQRMEVENLGVFDSSPIYVYRRVGEAIGLQPDVVIFLLSPWDLEQRMDPTQLEQRNNPRAQFPRAAAGAEPPLMKRIQLLITSSRTVTIAQHFLFQNPETYLRLYLAYGDKADFLRQPFTPAWQQRFADLRLIVGDMAARFSKGKVRLIVAAVPSRAEAALLSMAAASRPTRVDPFAFGSAVRQIAKESGAQYVDLMAPFSKEAHAERLYYVVDGHLTVEGHALVARELAAALMARQAEHAGKER